MLAFLLSLFVGEDGLSCKGCNTTFVGRGASHWVFVLQTRRMNATSCRRIERSQELLPVRRMCGAIPTYGEEVPPRGRYSVFSFRRGDGGQVKPFVCSRLSPVQVYCVGRHHANRCVPTSWCGADAGEETRDHSPFRFELDGDLGVVDVWKI